MRLLLFLTSLLLLSGEPSSSAFRDEQLTYPRVRAAYATRLDTVRALLARRGLGTGPTEFLLRAIKQRRQLEVWGRPRNHGSYRLVRSYYIAGTSGTLGPKQREGDGQVPEGCYWLDRFNPRSAYHLSLGLDYPNAADRQRSGTNPPGGDIFIHGSNVTIGCLPITNAGIEELYVLLVEARQSGQQQIPVHIFPFDLTPAQLASRAHSPHYSFWQELAPIYRYFEQQHQLPTVAITPAGHYTTAP